MVGASSVLMPVVDEGIANAPRDRCEANNLDRLKGVVAR
jgi:hypothetical protein